MQEDFLPELDVTGWMALYTRFCPSKRDSGGFGGLTTLSSTSRSVSEASELSSESLKSKRRAVTEISD